MSGVKKQISSTTYFETSTVIVLGTASTTPKTPKEIPKETPLPKHNNPIINMVKDFTDNAPKNYVPEDIRMDGRFLPA